ncbi:ABC transporter substrate-binding protein [Streptosporangium carneum]|uniref:Glycine/betaine-binding protein n=1 Tax=Streptosporangium carneum TaxID=47481 RepID=A0A9W6HX50_9ACTN|nr:ABC transporter substrate-binding protein [Streptosporangium carneum]GLK07952.1 glycine/betaine-binding protein [Streptosporangium carneum]
MRIGRRVRLLAGVLTLALASGCGGVRVEPGASSAQPSSDRTVRIAVNPWVGYEASAGVITYLLEKKLGYTVEKKELAEQVSWEGFEKGDVDVVVENWGHEELKKTFIQDRKVAVEAGSTGNKGVIGWYIPKWMADKYPDITDYRNLNKYASLFRTSESGQKGQLLFGDPSYVSNEDALIKNLRLNLKVVVAGSEAALIESATQAQRQRRPLLFYFWDPHWLFSRVDLVRIALPPHTEGCDADPEKVACDYAELDLDKIVSRRFADGGGRAYQLVKNFSWTNEAQNAVADDIANNGMSVEDASRKWVEANESVWSAWIPR